MLLPEQAMEALARKMEASRPAKAAAAKAQQAALAAAVADAEDEDEDDEEDVRPLSTLCTCAQRCKYLLALALRAACCQQGWQGSRLTTAPVNCRLLP